jgi:hypothetical protein
MIQEARYRIAYNKQRAQLRNLLQCVADEQVCQCNGMAAWPVCNVNPFCVTCVQGTVRTDQLHMAANLAGIALPESVSRSPSRSGASSPRGSPRLTPIPMDRIAVKPLVQSLGPPPLQGYAALHTEPALVATI